MGRESISIKTDDKYKLAALLYGWGARLTGRMIDGGYEVECLGCIREIIWEIENYGYGEAIRCSESELQ